ncbi:hypothetical protein VTK73DRAFT_5440 [Phialemonium thermophilum]|uniref:Secreted protein n=1 Tax=Phialemonium thermophilum TaxID=223376 RepID=A0ABR3V376_9PEZI
MEGYLPGCFGTSMLFRTRSALGHAICGFLHCSRKAQYCQEPISTKGRKNFAGSQGKERSGRCWWWRVLWYSCELLPT